MSNHEKPQKCQVHYDQRGQGWSVPAPAFLVPWADWVRLDMTLPRHGLGRPRDVDPDEWGQFAASTIGGIAVRKPWGQVGAEGTSVSAMRHYFPDDRAIYQHLFSIRFGAGHACSSCGRPARWRYQGPYGRYRAGCCKRQVLNVLTDTLFDRTRLSLVRWMDIMLLFANSKSGVSIDLAGRLLGVTLRAAFRVVNRIRWHIALLEAGRDIGGRDQPVHVAFKMLKGVRNRMTDGGGTATILIINDRQHVVAVPVRDRRTSTINTVLQRHVRPGSILVFPDEVGFRRLSGYGHNNLILNSFQIKPVQNFPELLTCCEVYWMGFRRTMRSTHVHMQRENVWKYVNEFSFRYNRIHRSHETFWDMICHFPAMPVVSSEDNTLLSFCG